MSASTVSITAAPTPRRRAVETRPANIELVSAADPLSQRPSDDPTSRDLSHHSIRTTNLDHRSRRTTTTAAAAVTSTASPPHSGRRSSRKTLTNRPRWLRFLRIFGKWLGLLLFVAGLGQILTRLAYGPAAAPVGPAPIGYAELEGRIAEVEASMKETSRMLQVSVDAASKKIDNEVGKLKNENAAFASDLSEIKVKNEGVEKSVEELKSAEWLSKSEFEKIIEEMKKERDDGAKSGVDLGASFDEIMAYAKSVVEKEIEKHAADGLGRADYALASGGAMVVKHSEPFAMARGSGWGWSSGVRSGVHRDAEKMLWPSFGEPGQCFPLKGSSGFVVIKLRTAIIPEAVTLEHVSKNVAYDRRSAPKDCRISGWLRGDPDLEMQTEKMLLLTEFTYDLEKSNAQTVSVSDSAMSTVIDTVRFDFTSNHGSSSHTCIYRLRVHGHEPDSVSVMAMPQS